MTQSEDFTLISNIREGSMEAFDRLMQKHQDRTYHIALGVVKNPESAMDIVQNTFIKVYENLSRFRGNSQFKTWLTRIAYNESMNWLKRHKKHGHQYTEGLDTMEPAETLSQEEELLARENRTLLLRSLYQLNTKYRLAVILRYFENYSIRDIAETLGTTEGVVKNMLFRSLNKLKTMLSPSETGV